MPKSQAEKTQKLNPDTEARLEKLLSEQTRLRTERTEDTPPVCSSRLLAG